SPSLSGWASGLRSGGAGHRFLWPASSQTNRRQRTIVCAPASPAILKNGSCVLRALRFCLVPLLAALSPPAQDLKQFAKNVTELTLANGLHFFVMERHGAPVVSFHSYVTAGSVDDPSGQTGIADMF